MSQTSRPTIHQYFMDIAKTVATRASCDRKHVGSLIVVNKQIVSTGYNGSIAGTPHCDEIGHMMEEGHCIRTVHAEVNAISQAAMHGTSVKDGTIYITANPCWNCFKTIANSGIRKIIYGEFYRDQHVLEREIEVAHQTHIWLGELQNDGKVLWDYHSGSHLDGPIRVR